MFTSLFGDFGLVHTFSAVLLLPALTFKRSLGIKPPAPIWGTHGPQLSEVKSSIYKHLARMMTGTIPLKYTKIYLSKAVTKIPVESCVIYFDPIHTPCAAPPVAPGNSTATAPPKSRLATASVGSLTLTKRHWPRGIPSRRPEWGASLSEKKMKGVSGRMNVSYS